MLACLLALPFIPAVAAIGTGKPIVADVSQSAIEIHSSFSGIKLLVFGARNDNGDIVTIIRGPERDFYVRKKERIAGIWINKDEMLFKNVPDFYMVASSKPLSEIKAPYLFQPLKIGMDSVLGLSAQANPMEREFSNALIRNQQKRHLYGQEPADVTFMEETLFKTFVQFPHNIPRGTYTAEIYLFSDGELRGMESTPIRVFKTGMDAIIYDLAHRHPAIYGMLAVIMALSAGWIASRIFEKV